MSRVGLCLGAGGLVGQAYQAGVLAALQVDLGWDARRADIVVGTSAGSLTGAMLRIGTSPFDLASWVLGRAWSPDQTMLEGLDAIRTALPRLELRALLRPWQIPSFGTWTPTGGRPWVFQPLAILSTMVPTGKTAMGALIARHLPEWIEETWPHGLWICAVRRKDGDRVVFGQRSDESTPLTSAVAASSAIPGFFAPVTVRAEQFLDGGIYSPTNADLLTSEDLDLAIIISPMSGGDDSRVQRRIRRFARGRVRREIERLEQAGTKVVCFEPGAACARAMGLNPMATDPIERVLQAAFFEAGELAGRPEVRDLLTPITATRRQIGLVDNKLGRH
jgi:NTE family protein